MRFLACARDDSKRAKDPRLPQSVGPTNPGNRLILKDWPAASSHALSRDCVARSDCRARVAPLLDEIIVIDEIVANGATENEQRPQKQCSADRDGAAVKVHRERSQKVDRAVSCSMLMLGGEVATL